MELWIQCPGKKFTNLECAKEKPIPGEDLQTSKGSQKTDVRGRGEQVTEGSGIATVLTGMRLF